MTNAQQDAGGVILVVDDEAELRELLRLELEDAGYSVVDCDGGRRAYEIVTKQDIDLVISDIIMPGGDGIELLEKLRERDIEKPPVILISAFARITVQEAYEKGAEAYFPKPFDREAMLETVNRLMQPKTDRWRRQFPRFDAGAKALKMNVAMPNLTAAANRASIINIGRGGMFLAWPDELPRLSEEVEFEITFLDERNEKFRGKGVVRWTRPERDEDNRLPGIGIEFTEIDMESSPDIFDVVNYIKTKAFIPRS